MEGATYIAPFNSKIRKGKSIMAKEEKKEPKKEKHWSEKKEELLKQQKKAK